MGCAFFCVLAEVQCFFFFVLFWFFLKLQMHQCNCNLTQYHTNKNIYLCTVLVVDLKLGFRLNCTRKKQF